MCIIHNNKNNDKKIKSNFFDLRKPNRRAKQIMSQKKEMNYTLARETNENEKTRKRIVPMIDNKLNENMQKLYCFVQSTEALWHNEWVIRTHAHRRTDFTVVWCPNTPRWEAAHVCVCKVIIESAQRCQLPRTRAWKNEFIHSDTITIDGMHAFEWGAHSRHRWLMPCRVLPTSKCCNKINNRMTKTTHTGCQCWNSTQQMYDEYVKSYLCRCRW